MSQVDSRTFKRSFGVCLEQARHEPVEITRHGRRAFVLMSADRHDWLKAAARRRHRTAEAADVVIGAVDRAGMDPEHARLDALLN